MADNKIQIKRSLTTAIPASLDNGELAYTAKGDVLYIGSNNDIVAIGGKRNPGLLTANQALVANSTSWLNEIRTANLVASKIYANGSFGALGSVLASGENGAPYWIGIETLAVGPQYVAYYDSRDMTGNLHFTAANTVIDNLTVTAGIINKVSPTITLGGDLSGSVTLTNLSNGSLNATITKTFALGTDTSGDYVAGLTAGNGASVSGSGGEGSTPTVAVVAGTGVTSNSSGVHIGQPVAPTDNVTFNDVTINGNTTIGSAIQDRVTFNASITGSLIPTADVTYDLGGSGARWKDLWLAGTTIHIGDATVTSTSGNTITVGGVTIGDNDLRANTGIFSGSLYVAQDLIVSGNLAFVNVETIQVKDPLILLGANNTAGDVTDLGFYGTYNDGTQRYSGLFRDASDTNVYKLFTNLTTQPGSTVDTTAGSYQTATLEAFLKTSGLTSNSSTLTITNAGGKDVFITANQLVLTTALGSTSGGTGFSTYDKGDLLVGASSGFLEKLGLGTAGYVLQSNGTALVYGTLDGGTF